MSRWRGEKIEAFDRIYLYVGETKDDGFLLMRTGYYVMLRRNIVLRSQGWGWLRKYDIRLVVNAEKLDAPVSVETYCV